MLLWWIQIITAAVKSRRTGNEPSGALYRESLHLAVTALDRAGHGLVARCVPRNSRLFIRRCRAHPYIGASTDFALNFLLNFAVEGYMEFIVVCCT